MADRKRKPRCQSCTQLRKDVRNLKQRNKDLDAECDKLDAIVVAGSTFLKLMVEYIDDGEN